MTADEIRKRILEVTLANGGHLASSLGAVEIAMALDAVFDATRDRIVWDVGHQAYAWKILTGRGAEFNTLRKAGGISGFPNPAESRADAAVSGHAGVALSVAEGLAAARARRNGREHVVAVVGDAAMANGTSLEALENLTAAGGKVIVVLNDNSRPAPRAAKPLVRLFERLVSLFGCGLVRGRFLGRAFFERFGLRYVGPVDGHDVKALVRALTRAKGAARSVLLHVVTKKGRGYGPAEKDPSGWHGIAPQAAEAPSEPRPRTWSAALGESLAEEARHNEKLVALTAGMRDGTGLRGFAEEFPDRFFDVGIAEGHMVSFAAGLAAGGLRPVVAVYSTFLQRAVDQVMHDVCIARLPVVFCVDRAGVVGADGVTHQGLYDYAMLKCLPNLTICQPKDEADLQALLREALQRKGPTVIRYPRGPVTPAAPSGGDVKRPELKTNFVIWATGDQVQKAEAVARRIGAEVFPVRCLKPFDAELLQMQRAVGKRIVSIENGAVAGGFGESIGADVRFGWPDVFVPHGEVAELERAYGMDVDSIVARLEALK